MKKALILLLLTAFANDGCSYLTSSGRQQAAYARYVRRSSYTRVKMQKKQWRHMKIPSPQNEPAIATSSGPESVTVGAEPPSQ